VTEERDAGPVPNGASSGVAITNWFMRKTTGLLEKRASRRGFLIGSALAGSAVAVAGVDFVTRPGSAYAAITDCPPGSLCTDGYTEFCCAINSGSNTCPPGSFAGGWWRADHSSFCGGGTRYYVDCMQDCCGPGIGGPWCAGCTACDCANGCDTRRVYCNYFRYGQCHQEITFSGPIACRVVSCVPPYTVDDMACSTAAAVDNATAEHAGNCPPPPPPPIPEFEFHSVLPSVGAATLTSDNKLFVFVRGFDGTAGYRMFNGTSWGPWQRLGGSISSGLTATSLNASAWLFGRGGDNGMWYRQYDGSSWAGWQTLGPTITSDPNAVTHSTGIYLFARGTDWGVWYQQLTFLGWSGWQSLGPTAISEPIPVADPSGLYVFVRGVDNAVWYRRRTGDGWQGWQSLGGTGTSDPSAVSNPTGLYVFVRGSDNAIWYRRLIGGVWSGWESIHPFAASDPFAVSDPSGVYVFIKGGDDALWYQQLTFQGWSGWRSLGPTITTDVVAKSTPFGLFVFAVGNDHALWYRRFSSGSWTPWQSLGGLVVPADAGR
jgi:hypothetical protein